MDISKGLVGWWKLAGDCQDYSGKGNHGSNRGADLRAESAGRAAAAFDGLDDYIEAPPSESLRLAAADFSISVWVHTDAALDDVIGDIVSKYDPATRRGFNFGIMNCAAVTSSQPNYRNLHFGIDSGRIEPQWTDCGRPGNSLFVCALAVFEGGLYAGTFETGADEAGHVHRYAGGTEWVDCGSPDAANSVFTLAVFNGRLYAGTACYRASGSALPDSPNQNPGGIVYRYEGGKQWTPCGRLGEANEVYALAVYRGSLYAIPMYSEGVFRLDGDATWVHCGTLGGKRSMALAVFNGHLYSTANERGGVWRYEGGTEWADCGQQADVTQTYSVAIHHGRMYVGAWPTGAVYRYEGAKAWTDCGRLGEEKEVMGMMVYNGKLYAGTLPLAHVYRYDGDGEWTSTGRLDTTPDVTYRRAWSMAIYQGRLFAGTLPSGHVLSIEAGANVTHDHELAPGWRHLAAVRAHDKLRLYVDGSLVAVSSALDPAGFRLRGPCRGRSPDRPAGAGRDGTRPLRADEGVDISNDEPLQIGFGAQDHFKGSISDLRIYDRALDDTEVGALHGM